MHGLKTIADTWGHLRKRALDDLNLTKAAEELATAVYYTGVKTAASADLDNTATWETMQQQFIEVAEVSPAFVTEVLAKLFTAGVGALNLLVTAGDEDDKQETLQRLHDEANRFLLDYEARNSTEH